MARNDRVRIGTAGPGAENIPVYHLKKDASGQILTDGKGIAFPQVVGGVKPGAAGTIVGDPIHVHKSMMVKGEYTTAAMGIDVVKLFPIFIDDYKQEAWVPGDFFKIVG